MRKFFFLVAGISLIYGCKVKQEENSIKRGRLEEVIINVDPSLGIVTPKALVYLPPDYDPNKKYPIIYMLHGFGGDYRTYVYYNGVHEILDYLISTGQMDPVIVVMPDGRSLTGGSFYTNSYYYDPSTQSYDTSLIPTIFGKYETYIIDSLIPQIERKYPVIGDRQHRAIMGLSMGSYGSAKLWLKHADLFGVVALHSGPLSFDMLLDENVIDSIRKDYDEIGGRKVWIKDYLGREHPWITLGVGLASAFTPRVVAYSDPMDWRVIPNCFYPGGLDSTYGDLLLDTLFEPSFGIKVCVGVRIPLRDTAGSYASCLTPEQQTKPNAEYITEDFCVWKSYHDPYTLIDSAETEFPSKFLNTKVYIDVGLKDELTLLSHNRRFKDKLKSKGLGGNLVYVEFDGALGYPKDMYPGLHSNWLYARLKKSFLFINRAFKGEDIKAGEYNQAEGKDYE